MRIMDSPEDLIKSPKYRVDEVVKSLIGIYNKDQLLHCARRRNVANLSLRENS